jgi:cysteine desulfurase
MDPIYLDHAATTPLREEVLAAMQPWQSDAFGNASSLHRWGRAAHAALEGARAEVAAALGARPAEIFFVRGGTESDNLALIGSTRAKAASGRPVLVISSVEHSAVRDAAAHLSAVGAADVRVAEVSADGALDLEALAAMIEGREATVSVMWVNNETGLTLPVAAVAHLARAHGATFHTDAAQAVGKVPVDLRDVPADLLTATGHKINGPKGTGVLFVREGTHVPPLLFGGGQERGLRPGTEDVSGAVGFATALGLAVRRPPLAARDQRRDSGYGRCGPAHGARPRGRRRLGRIRLPQRCRADESRDHGSLRRGRRDGHRPILPGPRHDRSRRAPSCGDDRRRRRTHEGDAVIDRGTRGGWT